MKKTFSIILIAIAVLFGTINQTNIINASNDNAVLENNVEETIMIDEEIELIDDVVVDEKIELDEQITVNDVTTYAQRSGVSISSVPLGYTHTGTAYAPDGSYAYYIEQDMGSLTVNGMDAFCIEPWAIAGNGSNYSATQQEKTRINRIVYHAYIQNGKTNYWRAVATLMIWEEYGYVPTSHNVSDYANAKASVNNSISKHTQKPSFDKSNYTIKLGESLTLTDTNNAVGTKELVKNNANVTYSWTGNKLKITPTIDSKDGDLIFNKFAANDTGVSYVYASNNPSEQAVYSSKLADPQRYSVNIKVQKYGDVKIVKSSENDNTLMSGVKYAISYSNAVDDDGFISKDYVYTTNDKGEIESKQWQVGKVYVQEVETLSGFVIDKTIHEVTIKANEVSTLNLENKRQLGQLNILKFDPIGRTTLQGAEFTLYKNNTRMMLNGKEDLWNEEIQDYDFSSLDLVMSNETDDMGELIFGGLDLGQYVLFETKAPFGYARGIEDVRIVNFESIDDITEVYIKTEAFSNHQQKGNVIIHKVEKDNNDIKLEGVSFTRFKNETRMWIDNVEQLWNEETQDYDLSQLTEYETIKTDENGDVNFGNLEVGRHFFYETETLLSHDLEPILFIVDVDPTNDVDLVFEYEYTIENKATEIDVQVHKIDSITLQPLLSEEVEFTFTNIDTKETWVVNGNKVDGIAHLDLTYGKYTLQETKAPKGYQLSKEIIEFEITGNEENQEYVIVFPNDLLPTVATGINDNTGSLIVVASIGFGLLFLLKKKRIVE